jgi:phosphatidylinositol glycan class B
MTALPSIFLGGRRLWLQGGIGTSLVRLTVWTIAVYSCLGHQEWRFLQPIVALLHTMAGKHLATPTASSATATVSATSSTKGRSTLSNLLASTSHRKLFLLHLSTLPLAIYLLLFHCIAQSFTLPRYLRAAHAKGELKSVGFLMPCHSTPWQSHLHLEALDEEASGVRADRLWFLSCEPPRGSLADASSGGGSDTYWDESDYFYADPLRYLRLYLPAQVDESFASMPAMGQWDSQVHGRMWNSHERGAGTAPGAGAGAGSGVPLHQWPSHLLTFEALLAPTSIPDHTSTLDISVEKELRNKGYVVEARLWNSLFHDDPRRRGRIVVWRWTAGGEEGGADESS